MSALLDPIAKYVEEGPRRARLRDFGVEVWALVAQAPAYGWDFDALALAYGVPREAVAAALAYYRLHKERVDAEIVVNAA